jgi:hypothetical protein
MITWRMGHNYLWLARAGHNVSQICTKQLLASQSCTVYITAFGKPDHVPVERYTAASSHSEQRYLYKH